jgi:cytidyltransferase-like protein
MRAEVLVSGTFNVLHEGHVELLKFASKFGDVTVGLNGDRHQQAKYGDCAIRLSSRIVVMESCRYVCNVVHFDEEDPSRLIHRLQPKFFIRGPDYLGKDLPEQQALDDVGAQLIIHHADKLYSGRAVTQAWKDSDDGFELWSY